MAEKLKNTLFKEVPVKIILIVYREGETYPTEISHRTEGSYSHIVRTITDLEELGLVESELRGRRKVISFTGMGKEVAERILEILEKKDGSVETGVGKEKAGEIESKVEEIYSEELEGKNNISREKARNIGKRLGPYKRELGKLEGVVDEDRLDRIRRRIDDLMELKNRLSR